MSKWKNSSFYLTDHSKLTFRIKFKNSECTIFGPICCKSWRNVFNNKLLDSLKIITVRERIHKFSTKYQMNNKIQHFISTSVTWRSSAYCLRIRWKIESRSSSTRLKQKAKYFLTRKSYRISYHFRYITPIFNSSIILITVIPIEVKDYRRWFFPILNYLPSIARLPRTLYISI